MRLALLFAVAVPIAACAGTVPQAALSRCNVGVGDGNDLYTTRQGAACRIVAHALVTDEKPIPAMTYARKACDLQDPAGCVLYLDLARQQPSELTRARSTGEKACDGQVVSADGTDSRPRLCFAAGELYDELEPRSADEAGRLYARACRLGDDRGCPRAKALGADISPLPPPAAAAKAPPPRPTPAAPAPTLAPTSAVVSQVVAPACHELRGCVNLDLQQRNTNEVVGTITNHCQQTVMCSWCPAKGSAVEKTLCHTGTLAPGETRTGQQWGLWYEGYNAMAYDCIEEHDSQGCLAL